MLAGRGAGAERHGDVLGLAVAEDGELDRLAGAVAGDDLVEGVGRIEGRPVRSR